MPRPTGSKNTPKSAEDLLKRVVAEYAKQGKTLSTSVTDIENMTAEQIASASQALKDNPDTNIANIFELEDATEDDDNDGDTTYKCGACNAELSGEESHCTHCGTKLNWE